MNRVRRLVGGLLVGALVAASCTATQTTSSRQLRVGWSELSTNLDSQIACTLTSWDALRFVNDPLVYVDADLHTLKPWLATSWEQTTPTVWTIKLRQGVKFQNGEPFNAQAMKFTIERFNTNPKVCLSTTYKFIDHVEVVDDYTAKIVTTSPNWSTMILLNLADMLPPKAVSDNPDKFATTPVGTGPYRVTEFVPNDHVTFEKNKDYWAYDPPYDKITWRVLKEPSTRVAALLAHEVDWINDIPVESIQQIKDAKFTLKTAPTVRPMSLAVNVAKTGPLNDPRVIQALQYAVDRKKLVDTVLGGVTSVMDRSVVHPSLQYAAQFTPYTFDLTKAKQLLTDAGHPSGISNCVYGATSGLQVKDKEVGEAVLGMLHDAGVNCQLDLRDSADYLNELRKGADSKFDVSFLSLSPASLGMDFALLILYAADPYVAYKNEQLNTLWNQARTEQSDQKRADLYKQAQQIAFTNGPFIHLYFNPVIDATAEGVAYTPRGDEWEQLDWRYVQKK